MAAIDQGSGAEDPDAYAARLAAMQRALQGASLKGPGGTMADPNLAYDSGTGNTIVPLTGQITDTHGTPTGGTQAPAPNSTTDTVSGAPIGRGQLTADQSARASIGGYAGMNPIDQANALNAANRSNPTPTQVAQGGSVTRTAPPIATTGGSLAPALTEKSDTSSATNQFGTGGIIGGAGAAGGAAAAGAGTAAGAGAGQTGTGGSGDLGSLTGSIMNQLQSIQSGLTSPGTPSDAAAVYLQQSQSILSMLDQQEAALRADAQKQGTTIDPATQFTLDKLRSTLEDNLKSTRENLNARGLYDSGIELQLENNLQKGTASDEAQILSTRLSKLQDDLNAGLTNIRSQRYSTANQFGLSAANAQTTANENSKKMAYDREQSALQGMLSLRSQYSAEQQAAAQRAAAAALQQSSEQFTGQQNALQRAAAAALQAQSEAGANSRAATSASTAGQMTAYQQAELQLAQNADARAAQAAQTANAGKYSATNTDQALNSVLNNYTYAPDALNAINQNAAALQAQGVDIGTLATEVAKRLPSNEGSVGGGGLR